MSDDDLVGVKVVPIKSLKSGVYRRNICVSIIEKVNIQVLVLCKVMDIFAYCVEKEIQSRTQLYSFMYQFVICLLHSRILLTLLPYLVRCRAVGDHKKN
jgi:hypothetical protein